MHVNNLFNGVWTVTVIHACKCFLDETLPDLSLLY